LREYTEFTGFRVTPSARGGVTIGAVGERQMTSANVPVTVVATEACPTAVVSADPSIPDAGPQWRAMLDEVWAFLRERSDLWVGGHNVMVYADRPERGARLVEAGVQVTKTFEPVGRVHPSSLPAVATATTVGPLSDIGALHGAVRTWCAANGRPVTGSFWEIYGDPDPETGRVDVTVRWALAEPVPG
jgi:hypothetical protein